MKKKKDWEKQRETLELIQKLLFYALLDHTNNQMDSSIDLKTVNYQLKQILYQNQKKQEKTMFWIKGIRFKNSMRIKRSLKLTTVLMKQGQILE